MTAQEIWGQIKKKKKLQKNPTIQKLQRKASQKKSKNMKSYLELPNSGICVAIFFWFWKNQMLYLGNGFQILQIFS